MNPGLKKSTAAVVVVIIALAAIVAGYFMWPKPSPVITEIKIGINVAEAITCYHGNQDRD
jgi:hypothetical protein